jgi:cysteine desulfurase/selenocysteine lyase
LDFVQLTERGELLLDQFKTKITAKVKLVAMTHVSNVTGEVLPIKDICSLAHKVGARVSVDGAQAVGHLPVNVQSLACDFYSFSGHKMYGPTGIGVWWGKKELLEKLDPYEYGGGMIDTVTLTSSTFAPLPEKFEAGTPNIAGAIGLSAAVDYLTKVGFDQISKHEQELIAYTYERLSEIKEVLIIGPNKRSGIISFPVTGIHAHDVASVLNSVGVAVRSGHHCCMPLHKKLNLASTVRVSLGLYNEKADIDALCDGIKKAIKLLN